MVVRDETRKELRTDVVDRGSVREDRTERLVPRAPVEALREARVGRAEEAIGGGYAREVAVVEVRRHERVRQPHPVPSVVCQLDALENVVPVGVGDECETPVDETGDRVRAGAR